MNVGFKGLIGLIADFILVSDDKYVKNLGICTYSIMHNMCSEVEKVRMFVMDCGITEENHQRLLKQAARFDNAEIIFYDIDKKLDAVMPKVETTWHRAIYGRLFLDEIAKQYGIDRLIYLDCDILMDGPITELFTMDLQGKCLAGVTDAADKGRKIDLGMPPDSNYINSGMLVIDTARWIELDASRRIIEYINSFPEALLFPDQDAINYILGGEMLILPPEYNMMWMLCYSDIPKMFKSVPDFYYTPEQVDYALFMARIIHYAGHDMWCYDGVTPAAEVVFLKYRKLSDWRKCPRVYKTLSNTLIVFGVHVKRALQGEFLIINKKKKYYQNYKNGVEQK